MWIWPVIGFLALAVLGWLVRIGLSAALGL
jgi:hypothetical protein